MEDAGGGGDERESLEMTPPAETDEMVLNLRFWQVKKRTEANRQMKTILEKIIYTD